MPHKNNNLPDHRALKEGVDFYLENGYLVFTAHYHKKRGTCCGSGCRHCPYRTKDATTAKTNSPTS